MAHGSWLAVSEVYKEKIMQLDKFLSQVSKQGLARANRWVVRVYPPRGLTATGNILNNAINKGGNKLDINLPILDAADGVTDALAGLGADLGNVSIGHNMNVPTLGYVLSNMGDKLEALNLFAASCSLPGRQIETVPYDVYGETRNIGVRHSHEGMSINYFCSENLREKTFFEQWQDVIFNPNNKRRGYYDDYVGTIEVKKYNANWKHEATYKFHECYPTGLSELGLAQDRAEDALQIAINFQFRYYEKVE